MAPEFIPPCFVQFFDVMVEFLLQIGLETLHTLAAVAFPSKLIGHMPQQKPRMVSHLINQLINNYGNLFSVDRRTHTMVMPDAVVRADTVGIHPHCLRIFFVQPCRTCPGRCGKHCMDSVFIKPVHGSFQPLKMKLALFGLTGCPRKDSKRHFRHSCFSHQADILFQYIRSVQPLLRVVVCSVYDSVCLWK